eukprot:350320-Chlamydomonas_euryale.AAC.13
MRTAARPSHGSGAPRRRAYPFFPSSRRPADALSARIKQIRSAPAEPTALPPPPLAADAVRSRERLWTPHSLCVSVRSSGTTASLSEEPRRTSALPRAPSDKTKRQAAGAMHLVAAPTCGQVRVGKGIAPASTPLLQRCAVARRCRRAS